MQEGNAETVEHAFWGERRVGRNMMGRRLPSEPVYAGESS